MPRGITSFLSAGLSIEKYCTSTAHNRQHQPTIPSTQLGTTCDTETAAATMRRRVGQRVYGGGGRTGDDLVAAKLPQHPNQHVHSLALHRLGWLRSRLLLPLRNTSDQPLEPAQEIDLLRIEGK